MLERSGQYRKDHIEAARAYDRTHTKEHQATRRNLAPEKHQARAGVARAVSRGDIKRLACEICSETKNIHAHHEDYSKPLDVVWLCVSCHGLRHREINDEQKEQAVGD